MASNKAVGRLSLYRRVLHDVKAGGRSHIFSHDLAAMASCSAAQVRRDMMDLGFSGSPAHGYHVDELVQTIGSFLDSEDYEGIALLGVGHLGRALLGYFANREDRLAIVAAFDVDESVCGEVVHGCRVYPLDELESILAEQRVRVAVLSLPAEVADEVTDRLIAAGITGILNFAPVRLTAPDGIYIEDVDLTMLLERVSYFARGEVVET